MVTLGARLRQLTRLRIGLGLTFALAFLAALSAAFSLSLFPPGLKSKSTRAAGAHTQILVDDRKVSVLDAGFDTDSFNYLHVGAVLNGSIMVQDPVRDYIAHAAGIPLSAIQFTDPQVPVDPPLPVRGPAAKYSVTVAARVTAPIIDVYAQAPTTAEARRLANASATGLSQYLAGPGNFGLRVTQLGRGADVSVASGALKGALERFVAVLLIGCILTLRVDRTRRSWRAGLSAPEPAS
jgi:hypothetical protein